MHRVSIDNHWDRRFILPI